MLMRVVFLIRARTFLVSAALVVGTRWVSQNPPLPPRPSACSAMDASCCERCFFDFCCLAVEPGQLNGVKPVRAARKQLDLPGRKLDLQRSPKDMTFWLIFGLCALGAPCWFSESHFFRQNWEKLRRYRKLRNREPSFSVPARAETMVAHHLQCSGKLAQPCFGI